MDLPLVGYSSVASSLESQVLCVLDVYWEGGSYFVCILCVILLMMEDEPDVVFM